jgi:hypothetical protein
VSAAVLKEADLERLMAAEEFPLATKMIVLGWLQKRKGVAVYRNSDLGHPQVGAVKMCSYGTPEAQIEGDHPPDRLPDIGGEINWRFVLESYCPPRRVAGD